MICGNFAVVYNINRNNFRYYLKFANEVKDNIKDIAKSDNNKVSKLREIYLSIYGYGSGDSNGTDGNSDYACGDSGDTPEIFIRLESATEIATIAVNLQLKHRDGNIFVITVSNRLGRRLY